MAFAQVASSQMQVRIKQSINIYNQQIADLHAKISRLEAFIPKLQFYLPDALARETQEQYYLQAYGTTDPTAGSW